MVRRTGKTGGEQAAEQGTQNLQAQLQQKANEAGLLVADNFQAQMLVSALTFIQQGQHGPKTSAILEAMGTGSTAPLEDWGNQILTWNQPALLSSASDSSG
ncbi:hypothetical protein [uncultured Nostoc sp.]|uniref:hypothetical protein n=1 Tax=uncultured Nostoc sp. TaxID=340711 RepID=UPI0035CA685E